jgi:hypothetical protein
MDFERVKRVFTKSPFEKLSEAEKEAREKQPETVPEKAKEQEKSPLDKAREHYVGTKLAFDKKLESLKEFENLSDEERERHFEIDPDAKKLSAELNAAKQEYFASRQEQAREKLLELEKEFKEKGLSEEMFAAEMKKASSAYVFEEFKKLYDTKTELTALQKQKEKPWVLKKIHEMSDEYRKMPLKKKLALSGVLLAGGVVAGAIGGGAGAALAAVVGGGRLSQRLLSSGAAFIGLEGVLKKTQEKELEAHKVKEFGQAAKETMEGISTGKAEELVKFLKDRDLDLERKGWASDEEVREVEKKLENRRYLLAGTMGVLMASGLTAEALANVATTLGVGEVLVSMDRPRVDVSELKVSKQDLLEAASKKAEHVVTIEKGGSVSQAARSLADRGQLSPEEFKRVWLNSYAEVKGVKIPLKDISLVHEGDQVVYMPGEGGSTGHFEVVDYAKDKFSLGTNQDLQEMYEKSNKEVPEWLQKATAKNIQEAFKDNQLDANDRRIINFHFEHGSLKQQYEIEQMLHEKMALPREAGGKEFSDLFVELSSSEHHAQSLRIFEMHLKGIGFGSADAKEFSALKNVKVGDLLEKRGGSWLKDYFFSSSLADKDGNPVRGVGMKLQRKLVDYIRILVTNEDKKLTVEQFLQKLS